jgi:hypothetical protein
MEREGFTDVETWRHCNEPHESIEKANEAIRAFLDGVGELRKQYRIADVLTVARIVVADDDGEERLAITQHFYGDMTREESMAATAYGRASAARQRMISDCLREAAAIRVPPNQK